MQQKLIKVLSVLLITTILYANSATVISYAADNFLSEKEIESQGTSTSNSNVELDVYYDGGKHSASVDVNKTDTKLNIALTVKEGYLKDATLDFSNSNFTIAQTAESENIESFDAEGKTVTFSQINNGTTITESINIAIDKQEEVSEDVFSKDNVIKFQGTYVNTNAKEVTVTKTITIHTDWTIEEAKANLQYEITKYIPYATNDVSKLITQGKVTSSVENSVLPIKDSTIEIDAPQINNEYPEEVTIVANTTSATNGDATGENFTSENWTYDSQTGKITIKVENDAVDGKIKWSKNTSDEYIITYIYSSEVYEAIKDTTVRLTYSAKSSLNLYGNGISQVSASVEGYQDQTDKLGEIVEFSTETTNLLNKGYIYNNKNATEEDKKETEYTTKYTAQISYAEIIDEITLAQNIDQFVTSEGAKQATTVSSINYAYDKTLTVSKQEFDTIFGENGQINILNSEGTILSTINKDTVADGEKIVVDLSPFSVNQITIQTSKPEKEGNITFEIAKALAKDIDYSLTQLESFTGLEVSMVGTAKNGTTDIASLANTNNIALEEPTLKANIETNKESLSTIISNTGLEIKVTLENDSIDDVMYNNPTVEVKLPENIESIENIQCNLYFDKELTVASADLQDNDDGTKSIIVKLTGKQTKYNNVAAKGAQIVITADVTLNKLTPSADKEIVLNVTNGDSKTVSASKTIQYIAPTGVVTTNIMSGYNGDEPELMSISGDEQEALIPTLSTSQETTFTMNVINNYNKSLSNVVVLGRTPFSGNKDISTSQDLGSNMDLTVSKEISVSGVDSSNVAVYYSTNGEADTDLSSTSNAWTQTPTDLASVKSYMIVLNGYTMNRGDGFTFTYNVTIPANLQHNVSAYENYIVYYEDEDSTSKEQASATKIGVTTGTGAVITAELTSVLANNATVASGETLEYTLTVKNTGTEDATDLIAIIPKDSSISYVTKTDKGYEIDEGSKYEIDEETGNAVVKINLGTVAAKSELTKSVCFETIATAQTEKTVTIGGVTVSNGDVSATTGSYTVTLTKTYFKKILSNTSKTVTVGETFNARMYVSSSESDYGIADIIEGYTYTGDRTNSVVSFDLPSELSLEKVTKGSNEEDITSSVTNSNGKISINLGTLNGDSVLLNFTLKANDIGDGVYEKIATISPVISADGTDTEEIGTITATINKAGLKISQTSDVPSNVDIKAGEIFTYTITIENPSNTLINNINFIDYLPEELKYSGMEIDGGDGTNNLARGSLDDEGNVITTIGSIGAKGKINIYIKVSARAVEEDTTVVNKVSITNDTVGQLTANAVTNTIAKYVPTTEDDVPTTNKVTKRIAGVVWIDKNGNGSKDTDEEIVSGIQVLLLDNSTGNVANDVNGKQLITTTDDSGAYVFSNVLQGKYTVIFFYDSANYSATTYQAENVDEKQNSDGIDTTVVYEGKSQTAAVTEEITVSNDNIYNIDLGIIEDKKFDLKLDKVVSKITLNNGKSTKSTEYNKNLAKIDIESKYQNSSSLVIEYKITVTNEGAVPGYAKKIVDYIPDQLKFSSEINTDWYEGKDGVVYNASLANTLINPGESKEITLILTDNVSENDYGIITNNAEIYESSNDYGLVDTDSTAGNKSTSEDDFSTANIILGVKTGQVAIYVTLTLTVIAIIGVGTYVIKKRVIR